MVCQASMIGYEYERDGQGHTLTGASDKHAPMGTPMSLFPVVWSVMWEKCL